MTEKNRRQFIKSAGMAAAAVVSSCGGVLAQSPVPFKGLRRPKRPMRGGRRGRRGFRVGERDQKFKLGLASYTLRKFSLEDTLAMTKQLGLECIALKSFHLPLDSSPEAMKKAVEMVRKSGITLYGCGVIYMKNKSEVNKAFDYARAAGAKMIVGVPVPKVLGLVDQKVKEYDIKVAIHNHGPGDKMYPTPESAYEKIKDLDKRIGLCNDIGHTQRAGVDPSESIRKYADRLMDVHLKDVSEATAKGHAVEIGRGIIDIPRVLRTLLEIRYEGVASFEYEKDANKPLAGLAESVGYVKGVLAAI